MDIVEGLTSQTTTAVEGSEQVILALIAIIATSIAALVYTIRNNSLSKNIARDARDASAAVNHKETGELSLYRLSDATSKKLDDVIARQAEFDRKWGNLPADMGDAVGLAELIHGMDKRISAIQAQLVEHVAWEMAVKYPKEQP